MLSPLDDLPLHQAAETMAHVATSDRNFYDRYYFNLHGCADDVFVIFGSGQYPNLGVTDAFVVAVCDGRQHVVRASRPLGADRLDLAVGPLSVEVVDGLSTLRLRCAAGGGDIELDVRWQASVPAFEEPRMLLRNALGREVVNTMRFLQTGRWAGQLRVGGREFAVTPDRWWGNRDRSWGVRPVGEPEPAGAAATAPTGLFWNYAVAQFADHSLAYLVQEDASGTRALQEAVRLFPAASGQPPQPLGRPDPELAFVPGTRDPRAGVVTFEGGERLTIEVLTRVYLARGTGYGFDTDWRHGMYQGPELVVQHRSYDIGDPATQPLPGAIVDALARFETGDGQVGYGLFETMLLGPHHRYFSGWDDVAG